jgi:hypothetical protein
MSVFQALLDGVAEIPRVIYRLDRLSRRQELLKEQFGVDVAVIYEVDPGYLAPPFGSQSSDGVRKIADHGVRKIGDLVLDGVWVKLTLWFDKRTPNRSLWGNPVSRRGEPKEFRYDLTDPDSISRLVDRIRGGLVVNYYGSPRSAKELYEDG